jgi:5'-3' exonuclease
VEFYTVDNIEADDCIGIIQTKRKELGLEFIICSPDKDVIRQIPGKHYNYSKKSG